MQVCERQLVMVITGALGRGCAGQGLGQSGAQDPFRLIFPMTIFTTPRPTAGRNDPDQRPERPDLRAWPPKAAQILRGAAQK